MTIMNKTEFRGVFTALLTPFDEAGGINDRVLSELIAQNLRRGVTGFYVGGSTAEVFLLSDAERRHLYETVSREAGGKCTLIAHVGAMSTGQAISYARLAKRLGYDAVSAVAPFYYKYTFDEIRAYYSDIAAASDLPVIVYHFPGNSGVALSAEAIGEFLADERFIGVKYTAGDYFTMERIKAAHPDKIVYNGYDETFLAGLAVGADGGIGSTYNFMAEKFVAMRSLYLEGKTAEARAIQSRVNEIIAVMIKIGVTQAEKEVLCQMGLDFGVCRRPFAPIGEAQKNEIAERIMPYVSIM